MRANDALFGIVLILFGLTIVWHARSFPDLPNQEYGSSLFPILIGCGFVGCGGILAVRGIHRRLAGSPWLFLETWAASRARLLDAASVVGGLLFYILLSNALGFLAIATILLAFWLVRFRRSGFLASFALAGLVAMAVDYAFRGLLLVPLPLGPFPPPPW